LCILWKSRNTPEETLRAFLQQVAGNQIQCQAFCFCPASPVDWEFVESLLKLEKILILGLTQGITKKAIRLFSEKSVRNGLLLAPEPPRVNKYSWQITDDAFYRLFETCTRKAIALHVRNGGKTSNRLESARKKGFDIMLFDGLAMDKTGIYAIEKTSKRHSKVEEARSSDSDDDRFISSL
ncbi:MAG: hypothetical protein ABH878_09190, partial [bacterium]